MRRDDDGRERAGDSLRVRVSSSDGASAWTLVVFPPRARVVVRVVVCSCRREPSSSWRVPLVLRAFV